jgi:hypothetical protein
MTPGARNWLFGAAYMDYGTRPTSSYARFVFFPSETSTQFWVRMSLAAVMSIVMMWIGIRAGRAMQRVRR